MNAELATPKERFRKRPLTHEAPVYPISFRIPEHLLNQLANYGNARNLSMSEAIRDLLTRALAWDN